MTIYPINQIYSMLIVALVLAVIVLVGLLCLIGRFSEALGSFERYEADVYGASQYNSQAGETEMDHA